MTDPTIVLGLDLGDRHIGVAIGNLITKTATPLSDFLADRFLVAKILELAQQYNFEKIIIGQPLTALGQLGEQAHKVADIVANLRRSLPMEIILEDERFTTQSATKYLAENPHIKASIDGASAKLILEGWLARQ